MVYWGIHAKGKLRRRRARHKKKKLVAQEPVNGLLELEHPTALLLGTSGSTTSDPIAPSPTLHTILIILILILIILIILVSRSRADIKRRLVLIIVILVLGCIVLIVELGVLFLLIIVRVADPGCLGDEDVGGDGGIRLVVVLLVVFRVRMRSCLVAVLLCLLLGCCSGFLLLVLVGSGCGDGRGWGFGPLDSDDGDHVSENNLAGSLGFAGSCAGNRRLHDRGFDGSVVSLMWVLLQLVLVLVRLAVVVVIVVVGGGRGGRDGALTMRPHPTAVEAVREHLRRRRAATAGRGRVKSRRRHRVLRKRAAIVRS